MITRSLIGTGAFLARLTEQWPGRGEGFAAATSTHLGSQFVCRFDGLEGLRDFIIGQRLHLQVGLNRGKMGIR